MQALGLIETRGLVVAVESADAMLKAADVTLLEKTLVGGGLVSIAVTGEVAAVKAAVDAGAAAVRQINPNLLVSEHVIPRPHEELENVMVSATPLIDVEPDKVTIEISKEAEVILIAEEVETIIEQESVEEIVLETLEITKDKIDSTFKEMGLTKVIEELGKLKVVKLRTLAREYKDFGIAGRLISKADKKMLIAEFEQYYGK